MDLIKREDAIKAVSEPFDRKYWHYTTRSIRDTVKALKDIPSYEPKQGEWICEMTKSQDQARDRWVIERFVLYCSECNGEAVKMTKFCPNCGARMEGVDDEL